MILKTREKLIQVARQLFDHKGVAKTTINDIASASKKGRRTVYTYFKNKVEIYNAVLESESEEIVTSLRGIVESDGDVAVRLASFLRFRLEHNSVRSVEPRRPWLTFDLRRLEKVNRLVRAKENAMLATLLREGCEKGTFLPERCRLLEGFVNECISRLVIPQTDSRLAERRDRIFSNFIEFIISDITATKDTQ